MLEPFQQNKDLLFIKEKHPHIFSRLKELWGTSDFTHFIDKLFFDTRDGTRAGFKKESASALHRISILHDEYFPEYIKEQDIWHNAR